MNRRPGAPTFRCSRLGHRPGRFILPLLAALHVRSVSAHGLTTHPAGWVGVAFDVGQVLLVVAFVALLVLTYRDRSR